MAKPKLYADLHVHPHYFKYWNLRWLSDIDPFAQTKFSEIDTEAIQSVLKHPNGLPTYNQEKVYRLGGNQDVLNNEAKSKRRRAAMGGDYRQSDPISMRESKTNLAVVSLSPVERAWFFGSKEATQHPKPSIWQKYMLLVGSSWELRYTRHFTSEDYNYFHEMLIEYAFYVNEFEKIPEDTVPIPNERDRSIRLAEDKDSLKKCLESNAKPVCIFSLESLYILSQGFQGKKALEDIPIERVLSRIHLLKDSDHFKYPFFYLTYSHHFTSGYAGHAKSLPALPTGEPANQKEMLGYGLFHKCAENLAIISKLLAIPVPEPGTVAPGFIHRAKELARQFPVNAKERRILIDVKHLAPRARKDFYEWFISPEFKKPELERIPVIASHVGYSGSDSLDEFDAVDRKENNNSIRLRIIPGLNPEYIRQRSRNMFPDSVPFLNWGINLCDEDIAVILKSRGLIGLSFDQRILGDKFNFIKTGFGENPNSDSGYSKEVAFGYIWANLLAMVYTAFEMCKSGKYGLGIEDESYIWKMFTIGTDYDGMIDPPLHYENVKTAYSNFSGTLEQAVLDLETGHNALYKISEIKAEISPYTNIPSDSFSGSQALIERICWFNLFEFVHKHWNSAAGHSN